MAPEHTAPAATEPETTTAGAPPATVSVGPEASATLPEPAGACPDAGAPPWLWFWFGTALVGLPALVASAAGLPETLGTLLALAQSVLLRRLGGGEGGAALLYGYTTTVRLLLPFALVLSAVWAVAVPWRRARAVERRLGLAAPAPPRPAVAEIARFVEAHAPGAAVALTANLLRPGGLALAYATGYRRAAVGVMGGLVRLWRADRAAAEAVLTHELVHVRRGDALIVGAGGELPRLVNAGLLLVLVPYLVLLLGAAPALAPAGLLAFAAHAPALVVSTLVLPVAALWSAELNADWVAAAHRRGGEGLRRGLVQPGKAVSWWRLVLFRLAYPPVALRRWLLDHHDPRGRLVLLLLYPAALLARLVALHAFAISAYFGAGFAPADVWARSLTNTGYFLQAGWPQWLLMGGLLLLWPWAAGPWERVFLRGRPAPAHPAGRRYLPYLPYGLAGALCLGLAVAAGVLGAGAA